MNYQKKSYIIFYISNYSTYSASSKESWIMKKSLTENCCFHKQKINLWSFFSSNWSSELKLIPRNVWSLPSLRLNFRNFSLCSQFTAFRNSSCQYLILSAVETVISKYKVCLHVTWSTYLVFQEEFLKIEYLNGDSSGNWEKKF